MLNGIKTNAVKFGKVQTFIAGLTLFTVADALLIVLATMGIVPHDLILVAVLLYLMHFYWSLRALREGLTIESVRWLQLRYRVRYAAIGAFMVISILYTLMFS